MLRKPMKDLDPRFSQLEQKSQAAMPLLIVVLLVFLIQLWLLTIALEEYLAARTELAIPTFLVSGFCCAFNVWMLRYLRDIDRQGGSDSGNTSDE